MKIRVYHAILFVALIAFAVIFNSVRAGTVTGDLEVSSDNEDLSTTRHLVGYRDNFDGWVLGVKHGKFNIKDAVGNVSLNDTRITYYRAFDKFATWGHIGQLYNSDWSAAIGEFGGGYTVDNKLYLEYSISKNTFETFMSFFNHTTYIDYTGSAEYKFTPQLTGIGTVSVGDMSDGNNYQAYKGNLVYDSDDVEGLSAQYHHLSKGYDSNSVGYFTPDAWTRNLFGVGYITGLGQWSFNSRLLTGPQSIDDTSGTFSELKLKLKYAVSNDADIKLVHDRAISTADGYEYNWNWVGIHVEYRL